MPRLASAIPNICAQCKAESRPLLCNLTPTRTFTKTSSTHLSSSHARLANNDTTNEFKQQDEEEASGAMSRRLSSLTEEALEQGGKSAQTSVNEAGFDDELKQRLLNRIADSTYKSENASALAQANVPSGAGRGTRDIAGARAWSGTESLHDATLRMLDDAAPRPIRTPFKIPNPRGLPIKIETGRKPAVAKGARLANARDKASSYSYLKDDTLSREEREKFRKELKERFGSTGASRSLPATIKGLQSLANERIEDAIARGQFKNLPRGKSIERDYNMSSPFLDTTEYFMNKIIQKQDIVPPWIEKQQEVVSTAGKFRARLRNDWKRYASRMIAAMGGSLAVQIARAEEYARAEAVVNPGLLKKKERLNAVDREGRVSQITLAGELTTSSDTGEVEDVQETITVAETAPMPAAEAIPLSPDSASSLPTSTATEAATAQTQPSTTPSSDSFPPTNPTATATPSSQPPSPPNTTAIYTPFRAPTWEANEHSYHSLAIENLNSLTRSYNLMAPKIAQKPYFFLARELASCYRDVAPLLAGEIAEKARAPAIKARVEVVRHKPGGILEKFGGEKVRVHDEVKSKEYGFKQFWTDLFAK